MLLENLPKGTNLYLEDREQNTLTAFSSGEIKINPLNNIDGVGRFYLHVSSQSLSTRENTLNNISLFQSQGSSSLNIVGLSSNKTTLKMYSLLGVQVINTSFLANGNDFVALPKVAKGVCLVKLENANGRFYKKIILE